MIRSFLHKAQLIKASGCAAISEPNQVGGLTATGGSGQISLSWTADSTPAPNAATSYVVERSIDGLGSWSTIATNVTTNSYVDSGLGSSVTRHYRVSSVNCFGQQIPSATANATTAAGSLSPSWSLDFSSGTPSGYTLTRASTGTYVDSSGYVASASTDIARLTHDSSGSRLGLLVEGQRTNYQRATENTTQAQGDTAGYTGTQNDGTAPDNAVTADRVELTSTGYFYKRSNTTMAAGTFTGSFYVKQKSAGQTILVRINGTSSGGTTASFTTTADWQRVSVTFTSSTSQAVQIGIDQRTGLGGPGTACDVLVWGFQIEDGAEATSYIPNTGTTSDVTRSADLVHVLDSAITSWGDPGALVVHFYPPGRAGTIISTDDASTAQVGIEASTTTAARAFWSSGSTATGTIGSGVQKAVHYWNGSTSKFCINGGTVESGTNNLTIANTDFVTLGAEATESGGVPGTFSQYANCVIRKVEFYSGTLSDSNLQTITT